MSKEAAQRAMREARYADRMARTSTGRSAPARPVAPVAEPRTKSPTDRAVASGPASEALCGHRSMNGRTCTREQGHTAKNHRYS